MRYIKMRVLNIVIYGAGNFMLKIFTVYFSQEREVKWTDVDGAAILGKYKGKPTKATIEHFRDGASCR